MMQWSDQVQAGALSSGTGVPAADPGVLWGRYLRTTTGVIYVWNGSAWIEEASGGGGADLSDAAPANAGGAASAGDSDEASRANHVHAVAASHSGSTHASIQTAAEATAAAALAGHEGAASHATVPDHDHSGDAGDGGLPAYGRHKQTTLSGNTNKTTTSTTFVVVDDTNLPWLSLSAVNGDVIEIILSATIVLSETALFAIDFEVDPPSGANTRTYPNNESGALAQSGSSARYNGTTRVRFPVTETGTWAFRPMWRVSAGTATMTNGTSGSDDTAIQFSVTNLGPVTA